MGTKGMAAEGMAALVAVEMDKIVELRMLSLQMPAK